MTSASAEEQSPEQAREAFIAGIKSQLEQAAASGQSPEQIRQQARALMSEEVRRQIPEFAAKARSWWRGFRRFLIVGAFAFGLAIGLALLVEYRYAAPLCERYAAEHHLVYRSPYYPVIGKSSSTSSVSGKCILANAADRQSSIGLTKLEPNVAIAL